MMASHRTIIKHDTLILAGGRASRLGGGDKGLIELNDLPLIEYSINRLDCCDTPIMISANRNIEAYQRYGHTVIKDGHHGDFNGPLAGILACLPHMQNNYLFVCPCDMPLLPRHIENKLAQTISETDASACALKHHNRIEPLILLLDKQLIHSIRPFLDRGERSVMAWLKQQELALYESHEDRNCFININDPADLRRAENYLHSDNMTCQQAV